MAEFSVGMAGLAAIALEHTRPRLLLVGSGGFGCRTLELLLKESTQQEYGDIQSYNNEDLLASAHMTGDTFNEDIMDEKYEQISHQWSEDPEDVGYARAIPCLRPFVSTKGVHSTMSFHGHPMVEFSTEGCSRCATAEYDSRSRDPACSDRAFQFPDGIPIQPSLDSIGCFRCGLSSGSGSRKDATALDDQELVEAPY